MSLATEAKPAELPLPGGRPGATVRLHPLLVGELRFFDTYLARRPGRLGTLHSHLAALTARREHRPWVPIPAFLLEHPGAGLVLVDTGLSARAAEGLKGELDGLMARFTEARMTPEDAVPAQLRARGLDPDSVGVVLMTHLHADHTSGASGFPLATFVSDRREWRAAGGRRAGLRGYHAPSFDQHFAWRTVDYDAPEVDSYATFGRALDLFGDGSVQLLSTPGHTHGHQSVLVRLRDREALIVGDAAYTHATLADQARPLLVVDAHLFERSLHEIQLFMRQAPGALVIPGHDAEAWAALDARYE